MASFTRGTWHSEFSDGDLEAVRIAISAAILAGHERTARAQTEYEDPDGDQDVYGVGVARAVQKELAERLALLDSYREEFTPRSRRKMIYIGDALLFPHRVGKSMPRDIHRFRLNYLSERRRDLLTIASNVKYGANDALFEFSSDAGPLFASIEELLESVEAASPKVTLFVPYYSSTPAGIGSAYWGPARLIGNYFEVAAPEKVTLDRLPMSSTEPATPVAPAVLGFAAEQRQPTRVRLRLPKGVDGETGGS